ncbi:hypothetical protein NEFER03_1239 [Nematocida sp. LUAm3]|nr:hypothetical protein NEFER03_1239 [Nematocida sp. LUAm3]KAI5175848.1 hypothetical protein NEFER02_1717 [Nematocida sp. LUAm2]KAI5178344.1 hypothetical protein NEFER01_1511 [Nematocida sp. LUAm1]
MPIKNVLMESLSGIEVSFVYIPKEEYLRRKEEVDECFSEIDRVYYTKEKAVIRIPMIHGPVQRDDIEMRINGDFEQKMIERLRKITCLCGCREVENQSVLRMPSDGWEELVDMWSCHNREFEHLLEKKLAPRENGVLYSPLCLYIDRERAPSCLQEKDEICQIFYNELKLDASDESLLFYYLYEKFQTEKRIVIQGDCTYTLKMLEVTNMSRGSLKEALCSSSIRLALKIVFVKEYESSHQHMTSERLQEKKSINEYYSKRLIEILKRNNVSFSSKGESISFVMQ